MHACTMCMDWQYTCVTFLFQVFKLDYIGFSHPAPYGLPIELRVIARLIAKWESWELVVSDLPLLAFVPLWLLFSCKSSLLVLLEPVKGLSRP